MHPFGLIRAQACGQDQNPLGKQIGMYDRIVKVDGESCAGVTSL